MSNILIVTKNNNGLVDWLAMRGLFGEVKPSVTLADVRGKDVIGIIPMRIAWAAKTISLVDFKTRDNVDLPRDAQLTADEMIEAGATLYTYTVRRAKSLLDE